LVKKRISNAPIMIIQKAYLQKQWEGRMNTSWYIYNQRKTVNRISFFRESLIDIDSYNIHRKLGILLPPFSTNTNTGNKVIPLPLFYMNKAENIIKFKKG
jgi:hypothetical protein